jgi:hypothetical protein
MYDRFGKAKFAARKSALANIGNPNTAKVIPSAKDKADNPRKQRKDRIWEREWNRSHSDY